MTIESERSDVTDCFHCGLPVPDAVHQFVRIGQKNRPMCCVGCKAVAEAIVNAGMDSYYAQRDTVGTTAEELVPDFLRQLQAYDDPQVQRGFVRVDESNIREAALILEGISCAACVWLNERYLQSLPGVESVSVNFSTHRARIRWDSEQIALSEILAAVSRIGYRAHPYDPHQQQAVQERAGRDLLRRLGVAGVFGMQVMMIAVALYGGEWWGIDPVYRRLLTWASFVLTVPILFYAAAPFFKNAWRDLRMKRAGMDVPVTIGISLAFLVSVWHTIQQNGPVYFESVAMFVFFLLTGRYLEWAARRKAMEAGEGLLYAKPQITQRWEDEKWVDVIANRLQPGDRVLVRSGEAVPADGKIIKGCAGLDESLLTGESEPVTRGQGDDAVAGSVNTGAALEIQVTHAGAETVLAGIQRLLDAAQTAKPAVASLADRLAGYFVVIVLSIATVVGLVWYQIDPDRWLAVTISVLVVSCPCALSLATPTAVTAALAKLTRHGFLVKNGAILERLAQAKVAVFDKTGTLTVGQPTVEGVILLGKKDRQDIAVIASALEQGASHPLAQALRDHANASLLPVVHNLESMPGQGVQGEIDRQIWRIGNYAFVAELSGAAQALPQQWQARQQSLVFIGNTQSIEAVFTLSDRPREGAENLVHSLRQQGLRTIMLSGDHAPSAQKIATQLGIDEVHANLSPQQKLEKLKALQLGNPGGVVMVGDGVNDAPALAQADASIAMGSGTQLAAVAADAIQMGAKLDVLANAWKTAASALRVIRQNLIWALSYNLLAIPAAAMGLVQPWLAALGMSLSSLVVVWNASRLSK